MTGRARAVFFRCFSVMFRAGVPLAQCFDLLATQSEEPSTRQISAGLADSLRAGQSLEKAMSQYPEAFAKIHLSLIVMGARSGSLDHALSHLADYEERRRALELQLRNSMTYPAIVIALTAVLLLWLPSLAMGEEQQSRL
jgi:type IV pilus assembly protein PilC